MSTNRCLGAILLALSVFNVSAATRTWDGSANGYLSTPANWVGGVAPVNGDNLVFPATGVSRFLVTNNIISGPRFPTITFNGSGFTLSGAYIVTSRVGGENPTGANRVNCPIQLSTNGTLYMNGGAGASLDINGDVTIGAYSLAVSGAGGTLFVSGAISGSGGISKISGGTVRFDGTVANTYTGPTTVFGGTLELSKIGTLAVPGNLTVNDTVRLLRSDQIASNTSVTIGGFLDLNGWGNTIGALTLNGGSVTGGTLTLNGNVTATSLPASIATITSTLALGAATRTFRVNGSQPTADLQITGAITGAGGLTKVGLGILMLSGSASNTYTGMTRVDDGTLYLRRTSFDRSIPGDLFVGDGFGPALSDVVRIENFSQINNLSAVTIASSGYLDVNGGVIEEIGSLAGEGRVNVGIQLPQGIGRLGVGRNGASTIYSGQIVGLGEIGKQGTGTLTLTGNNTYSGATLLSEGTLLVNGAQPQSPVSVSGSATLGGTGVVGHVSVSGNLRPGTSPGLLTCSNLSFAASGDFFVELNGGVPGAEHDQLLVRGGVTLNNSTLHVPISLPTPAGQRFTIINNDGSDAVVGTFLGLAEGATFTGPAGNFRITYQGGDGNDVVLTRVGALTTAFGLQHVGLEQVTFGAGPSGELIVGNLAPSGTDGVFIPLGDAQGWQGRFTALDPGTGRGRFGWEIQGQLGSLPLQRLTHGSMEVIDGEIHGFADSRPVGANGHWVEVFAGDRFLKSALVLSNAALFRLLPPFATPPVTTLRCEGPFLGKSHWSCDISWSQPLRIIVPGSDDSPLDGATRVRVTPWVQLQVRSAVLGSPFAVQLTGRDISEIRISDEALLFPPHPVDEGLPHRALGQARFNSVSNGGHPIVSNLNSSDQDGVSIDTEDRSSGVGILIAPISLTPTGTVVALSAVGTFDSQPNRSMGTASLRRVGTALQAVADFTPVGSTMVRVEVFRGSTLMGSAVVPPGVVATASGGPDLPSLDAVGWIPPCYFPVIVGIAQTDFEPLSCYFFHFDKETLFTMPGTTALIGDSLRLLQADAQPRAQSLTRLDIRAALGSPNSSLALIGEKLRLPAPEITRIFPQQTRAGEIVEIRGRGFGNDASDLGIVGSARVAGLDRFTVPFHVLSASDTRILARVGNLPLGTPDGPIQVFRGVGNQGTLQGISADVEFLQPVRGWTDSTPSGSWQDDSVNPPIQAVQVYTPAKFKPAERWFYSEPVSDGVLCLYIYDWRPNAIVAFSSHITASFREGGVSVDASAVRFVGGADVLEGGQKLAEVLEAAFLQLAGFVVNVEASRPQDGTAKLTLSLPTGHITGGFLNVCVRSSAIEMTVADVHPRVLTEGDLVTIKGQGFGDDTRDLRVGMKDEAGARFFPMDVLRATDTQILARMGPAAPDFTQGPVEVRRGNGYQLGAATPSDGGLHRVWLDGITAAVAPNVEHRFVPVSHCFYSLNNTDNYWFAPLDGPPYTEMNAVWPVPIASVTIKAVLIGHDGDLLTVDATITRDIEIWTAYDFAEALEDALFLQAGVDSAVIVQLLPQEPGAVPYARLIPYILPTEFVVLGSFSICIRSIWPSAHSFTSEGGRLAKITGSGFGNGAENLSVVMLDGGGTRLIPLEVRSVSDTEIIVRMGAVPPDAQPGPIMVTHGQGSFNLPQPFFDEVSISSAWTWLGRESGAVSTPVLAPTATPPEAGQRWYFSDPPSNGELCVVLDGDWPSNAVVNISVGIQDSNGVQIQTLMSEFNQNETLASSVQKKKDELEKGFWQQAGVAVDGKVIQQAGGRVKLSLSLCQGSIVRGFMTVCVTEPPVITILPTRRGGPGDVVTITGRGFGTKPEDLLVYVEGKNGVPTLLPVLSATETQIVAVVGVVRPEAQAGPIVVARGDGAQFQKVVPGIVGSGLQQWIPDGEVFVRSNDPFDPIQPTPTFNTAYFYSVETNGVICVEVEGDWPQNVRVVLEFNFSSTPPDPSAPPSVFSVNTVGYIDLPGGSAQGCAQAICAAFDGTQWGFPIGVLHCAVVQTGPNRFKLTFSGDVPIYGVFNICYNKPIVFGGLGVYAAGPRAQIGPVGGGLRVSNIGSSGLDGVRWTPGESQGAIWDWRVPATLPAGARLILEASGQVTGPSALIQAAGQTAGQSEVIQRTTLEWLGADLRITPDFSPAGATRYQRKLFRNGTLVHQQTGLSGVAALVRGPTGIIQSSCFLDPIGCSFQFVSPLAMALGGGTVIQADTLVLLSEDASLEPESLSSVAMLGANLPEFTIEQISLPSVLSIRLVNRLVEVSWTGEGTLEEADGPSGPWRDVLPAPASKPHIQPSTGQTKFFRLRQ